MLGRMPKRDQGDTLIEVLFAIVIFSLIIVVVVTLMNQGTAAAQRSLEITTVRQQMDGQAETLRFLHESYVDAYQSGATSYPVGSPAAEYYKIIQRAQAGARVSASQFGGVGACRIPADASKDFVVNPVLATFVTSTTKPDLFKTADTFSQIKYGSGNSVERSEGMWIEAVRSGSSSSSSGYIDFHIRACWDVPGSALPMNLGTIVRLYEPRG